MTASNLSSAPAAEETARADSLEDVAAATEDVEGPEVTAKVTEDVVVEAPEVVAGVVSAVRAATRARHRGRRAPTVGMYVTISPDGDEWIWAGAAALKPARPSVYNTTRTGHNIMNGIQGVPSVQIARPRQSRALLAILGQSHHLLISWRWET